MFIFLPLWWHPVGTWAYLPTKDLYAAVEAGFMTTGWHFNIERTTKWWQEWLHLVEKNVCAYFRRTTLLQWHKQIWLASFECERQSLFTSENIPFPVSPPNTCNGNTIHFVSVHYTWMDTRWIPKINVNVALPQIICGIDLWKNYLQF